MKLNVIEVLTEGIKVGVANVATLLLTSALWLVSLIVPYLNVGTTIAMFSLPVGMSKGTFMSPTEIFSAKYRRHMGEFFLLWGWWSAGILVGFIYLIIPGMVIAIAWSQSFFLLFDRGLNPSDCLRTSNAITYGEKWSIFFIWLALGFVYSVILFLSVTVVGWIFGSALTFILVLGFLIIFTATSLGVAATIYAKLSAKLDDPEFKATLS